jgi:hypothetical protein
VVELVVADEARTMTAEDVLTLDDLTRTELCTDTTEVNVVIEAPEVGVVSTAEEVKVKLDKEEEDKGLVYWWVLGWVLTDEDVTDEEAWVLEDAPPIVPDGAMLRAM